MTVRKGAIPWGRMASCAAIDNRRACRLPIGTQLARLPHKRALILAVGALVVAQSKALVNQVLDALVLGASMPLESGEIRHTELGETTEGRLQLVVWTWRRRRIRVVTAFPADRKGAYFGSASRENTMPKKKLVERSEEHTSELQSLRHLVC